MDFLRRNRLALAFAIALCIVAAIVWVSYRSTVHSEAASRAVAHTHEVVSTLQEILAEVEHAETAQRAFVITGVDGYAAESVASRPQITDAVERLAALVSDSPQQTGRVRLLRLALEAKLQHVQVLLETRRSQGFEAARLIAMTGEGKVRMDRVHAVIRTMEQHERSLLARRQASSARETRNARLVVMAGGALDFLLLACVFYMVRRDERLSRQLAGAMRESRDAALQAAEVRSQFLANMSHEIRTPMNAVVGMSGLLLDTKLDDYQRDIAKTVRTSADALLTVINDVLDFSKLEAGKLAVEPYDFELRPAVEAVIDLFSEAAHQKNVTLGILTDHDLPRFVHGDAGRIRQVLTNLVGNALKFTATGDVIVVVDRHERRGSTIITRFAVHDTGIGIPADVLPQLFQPFTQADATTTRKFGGTGLGLAISKQIVESMGGTIGADSTYGRGSTFWFELPLQEAALDESSREWSLQSLADTRVLLVDDNATNRRILRHDLAAWKMQTEEATNADEAMELLRAGASAGTPYDLLLTDMNLPKVNGVMLARLVKCDRALSSTHIIVVSSMAERLEPGIMRVVGIDECLSRPVKQSALFDAIATALSGGVVRQARLPEELPARAEMRTDMRVLVAEDNPVNQKVAVRQLERLGVGADAVANGLEAVEAISRGGYALVLMDVQMPEMDGFAASQEIRRRGISTPIVALTANALAGDRERCLAAGMDDYLSKPIIESELARVLRTYLPAAQGEAALDREVVENLRALGDDFLKELAVIYLGNAPERMDEIRAAAAAGDADAVARAAHSLKSSSGNVGGEPVRRLCEELELAAMDGRVDELKLAELERQYIRLERELRKLAAA